MTTLNIDKGEIAKFERLAPRWWDKEGEAKPLHQMNPIRANYIDEKSAVAEKKVLDVGCGGGLLCEALAQRGAIVTGIDMGEAPLEVAKLHALESQLTISYEQKTAEEHAEDHADHYDIVTCLEMLEHVPDPTKVIKACAKMVKPGGDLFFSTINRNPKAYAFAIWGAEYVLNVLPKGTHDYDKFIKPSELSAWCREAELSIQDICGITYNPLTKKFKTQAYDVDVNYIVHAKRV